MNMKLEIPKHWVKKRSDVCIVCGFNPKDREKSIGCFHYGKKIANRHQYLYFDEPNKQNHEN